MSSTVTLHVWRVPVRRLPAVAWRMAADRSRLRALPGVRFAKLLGTAPLTTPAPTDGTRWAALLGWADDAAAAGFETSRPAVAWARLAHGYCRLDLRPIASRGRWSGVEPFTPTGDAVGPVLALTRARLRPSRAVAFWRAKAGPTRAVHQAPGLVATFGFGEAPVGWPGTVSLWQDGRDLVEFAYRHPAHRRVVVETPAQRWYAEELFARFAVVAVTGDRGIIDWHLEEDGSVR